MFKLSDHIDLGSIDTQQWFYFAFEFETDAFPALLLIKNGTTYYKYSNDIHDVNKIISFVEGDF